MKILLLPGYACESWTYDVLYKQLMIHHKVELVDWPIEQTGDFDRIQDFSDWLRKEYDIDNFDVIIGHSMGGTIAMDLSIGLMALNKLILLDTFLVSPSRFYHNFTYPSTSRNLTMKLFEMMKNQKKYYSSYIGNGLKKYNTLETVRTITADIHCIYGDRGDKDRNIVDELNWNKDLEQHLTLHSVTDACHFPMLESASETYEIILKILELT